MAENADWEAQHRLDARVDELEDQHRDMYEELEPKVIWLQYREFYTDDCDWLAVTEGDCTHPRGWHSVPYRIRSDARFGYVFETIRRRPDNELGRDWTPMNSAEVKDTIALLLSDRLGQLRIKPEIEQLDD